MQKLQPILVVVNLKFTMPESITVH